MPDRKLAFEVEHTSAYGASTDMLLNAERQALERTAAQRGLRASFDSPEPGYRGGRCFWATLTAPNGARMTFWINALAAGDAHYVVRMTSPAETAMDNVSAYRNPLVTSLTFQSAETVVGSWTTSVTSTRLAQGRFMVSVPPRELIVSINFAGDGTYEYSVLQTSTASVGWLLQVRGRYNLLSSQGNEDLGMALRLVPTTARFDVPPGTTVDRAHELQRVQLAGLPGQDQTVLSVNWRAGQMWTKLQGQTGDYVPMVVYNRGAR